MRRITLILSDLYLPEEAGSGGFFPAALDLPNLDWLLRFAQRAERIADWRQWLSADLGGFDLARLSLAECCALGLLPTASAHTAWLATPVHLEARIDHVRLTDRGLLRLDAAERAAWREEFALAFGPEYQLHDAGERAFILTGMAPARVTSVDPVRLLGADIGGALPKGPSAGELRRLGAEIEMWLHGASANARRERRRERRISALWLWGGGPGGDVESGPTNREPVGTLFFGGDPFLAALAGGLLHPAPSSYIALGSSQRCVVELAPMSGTKSESLTELDALWFEPIRDSLSRGALDCVDLVANDRWFRMTPRAGWRFWRRQASWLERLARPVAGASA